MRGESLPPGCGSHIDCAWGCPGCPAAEHRKPGDTGYFECPRCHERSALWHFNVIACRLCRMAFHSDFGGFVAKLRTAPDPPAEDT